MSEEVENENLSGKESEELEDEVSGNEEEGTDEEQAEDINAEDLLAQGKKCLAAGDALTALECLQEVCSTLANRHGQVSRELAEPYYLYGRALLEVARERNTVFGEGVPGGGVGVAEETAVNNGTDDNESGTGSRDSGPSTAGTASGPDPVTGPDGNGTAGGDNSEVEAGQEKGAEQEEEESDLKLAWEVLELARLICQKETSREFRLKLSDVSLALGEVGLESDQNDQAIVDFQSCLRLREFLLEPTDRRIAEVHFQLGMAHMMNKQAALAVMAYQSAKSTLVKRKESLEEELKESRKVRAGSGDSQDMAEEVAELVEIIKDVESKIVDSLELQKVLEEKESTPAEESSSTFDQPDPSFAKPAVISMRKTVNDVSHLVRKRPCEGESEDKGGVVKRVKLGESVETRTNGTGTSSPSSNS